MTTNIHASCVMLARAGAIFAAPADAGVLILGESDAGKSQVALRLMAMGAMLVADDRVELFVRDGRLWARPPASLAGLIEARGVGVVAVTHASEARIALAVQLGKTAERLPETRFYAPPTALDPVEPPPLFSLPVDDKALAEKIVLATAAVCNALFREEGNPP